MEMMDEEYWLDTTAWGLSIMFVGIFVYITFKLDKWPEGTNWIVKILTTIVVIAVSYMSAKFQLER